MTYLVEAVEDYLDQSDITCPKSERRIRATSELMGSYLERPPTIDDLTIEAVRGYLVWRAGFVGESATLESAKSLLSVWRWLGREGVVDEVLVTPKHLMPANIPRYRVQRQEFPPIEPCEATVVEWIDGLLERTS